MSLQLSERARALLYAFAGTLALLGLCLLIGAPVAVAGEPTTTLNFETPVIPGTASPQEGEPVSTQYVSQGVEFIQPDVTLVKEPLGWSPFANAPPDLYRDDANAPSSSIDKQVLYAYACFSEGCSFNDYAAEMFGVLSEETTQLELYAGTQGGGPVELAGYNLEGKVVAEETKEVTTKDETLLQIKTTKAEIAYFSVARLQGGMDGYSALEIADLSFVVPLVPPPAAIALDQNGLPNGPIGSQGTSAGWTVDVERFNQADEPIDLHVSGLPSGVTLTGGTTIEADSDSTTLTFSIAKSAPIVSAAPFTISATSADVPEPPPPITEDFSIESALQVKLLNYSTGTYTSNQTVTLTPCSGSTPEVVVMPGRGVSTPTSLTLSASGNTSGLSYSLARTSVPSPGGEVNLAISQSASSDSGEAEITITGENNGFRSSATVKVLRGGAPTVSSFYPPAGNTPQALHPGTTVTIGGSGFCPGSTVDFGNPEASATPSSINSSGTELTANVPALGTAGPVSVVSGGVAGASAASMTINSYRNVDGYQFKNYDPHIDFEQLTDAFGEGQTYDTIDFCWPFGCDVHVRDPFAMIFNAVANASITNGACFGISLSTQRLLEGHRLLGEFPPGNEFGDIFGLENKTEPTGQLTNFINAMHVQQLSIQFLTHWLEDDAWSGIEGGAVTSQTVYAEIKAAFAAHEYPLVSMLKGGEGHVVVAYNLEGAPPSYYIDVYDSNEPFNAGGSEENSSSGGHHKENWEKSRVHVGSDGEWSLPSTGISGENPGLIVTTAESLPWEWPDMPTPLGLVELSGGKLGRATGAHLSSARPKVPLGGLLFGSAGPGETAGSSATPPPASGVTQLTDAAGHTLFAPNGTLNENPATRLVAAPFASEGSTKGAPAQIYLLPRGTGTLKATVTGTGAGPDTHTLIEPHFVAQIDTQSGKGVKDTLTFAAGSGKVGFATQASDKPLALTLLGGSGKERRTVEVTTTSLRGAGDTLAFTGGQSGLSFTHHGAPTTFKLTLSAQGPKSAPTVFESAPMHIGTGASASIGTVHWGSLAAATVHIEIGGHSVVLHNRTHSPHLASIKKLSAKQGHKGTISLTIAARLKHLPTGAQLAYTWKVSSGRRVVAHHAELMRSDAGSASYTFTPKRNGRYTLTGTVIVVTIKGVTQSTSRSSRTLSFKG